MVATTSFDQAPRGRRRDPSINERVLTATRTSLVEHGWDGTSIRGIAKTSGVSRPAIARRWPSKAHLALEALLGPEPDLGAFEGVDLLGWVNGVVDASFELFERDDVRAAMPALLATLRDHDDLRRSMWDRFSGPASELAVGQGAGATSQARAAIAVAAGAALFSSVLIRDDHALRDEIRAFLRTALTDALVPEGPTADNNSTPE